MTLEQKALYIYKESLNNNIPNVIHQDLQKFYIINTRIQALMNSQGGTIILGENNQIKLSDPTYLKDTVNKIKNISKILSTTVSFKTIPIKYNGNNLIIVMVPELPLSEKPVYNITRSHHQRYYYYNGTEATLMPKPLLEGYLSANQNSFDEDKVAGVTRAALVNKDDINEFITKIKKEYPLLANKKNHEIFEFYKFKKGTNDTVLYTLLFTYFPQSLFPELIIKINNEITNETKNIDGSLIHQYNKTIIELKHQLNYKLLLNRNNKIINKTKYLFEIIEELLFNAIAHRAYGPYERNESIIINIKQDKLEIISPGYYLSDTTNILESKFKYLRNPKIKKIMDMLIDKKHKGFKYIKTITKLHGIKEPAIIQKDNWIVATIYPEAKKSIYQDPYTIDNILEYTKEPKSKLEIYHHFFNAKNDDYKYFSKKFLEPLIEAGLLELTIPDKPTSKYQRIVAAK